MMGNTQFGGLNQGLRRFAYLGFEDGIKGELAAAVAAVAVMASES